MASIGHVAMGLAAARLHAPERRGALALLLWCAVSFLPDADVIAFRLGIPYDDPYGHRGATHSVAFAALVAAAVAALAREARWRTAGLAFAVCVSHPLLDALTDGGLGVAIGWPLSEARWFAPWRPLPVAPIGAGIVSRYGLYVLGVELAVFAPVIAWSLWPRRRPSLLARGTE